jgi:diadenosine tetraphosphate (Ap4A) HIT family hydrolase
MSHRNAVVRYELHPQLAADTHPVAVFGLCDLRLMDDANYPWLVLVPRVAAAREMLDLDHAQRHALTDEIDRASHVLQDAFRPHKLNVAALGNLVPQLHVHVIARFEHDPAWPSPVWGRVAARPYTPEALVERIGLLQATLQDVADPRAPLQGVPAR